MTSHTEIEASQPIARQRITTALEDNSLGLVVFHDGIDDGLKEAPVALVIDTIAERDVDSVVLTSTNADVAELAGAGEVLAIFVEGAGHDAIGGVEGFLDAVAVMHINVDIEHALFESEKFDDGEHNVCGTRKRGVGG